jgi:hypothetical protein
LFQNEIDWDETITTILDDGGQYEDVQVFIDENEIFIRQWNENIQRYDLIVMNHRMFLELQEAMNYPEGMFRVDFDKNKPL